MHFNDIAEYEMHPAKPLRDNYISLSSFQHDSLAQALLRMEGTTLNISAIASNATHHISIIVIYF